MGIYIGDERVLVAISRLRKEIMAKFEEVLAAEQAEQAAIQQAVTLLDTIFAALQALQAAGGATVDQLQQIMDLATSGTQALNSAVARDTPPPA